eukprot:gene13546-13673_t
MQLSGGHAKDIITLNVGGRLFSTQRKTLCIVEESLLGLMFGGRWPEDAAARDSAGNVFLDADPSLFEVVLNWLRKFSVTKGPAGPHQHQAVHEPDVPPEKVEHMVALLDYLQLHRHVPLRYQGLFHPQHHSPFMMVNGATATRTKVAAMHAGKPKGGAPLFAVSDHTFFDMAVDITLEVLHYKCSEQAPLAADFMFIGFIHKDTISLLDPQGDINTQLTKLPSCYGWLTGRNVGYYVRNGKRSQMPCHRNALMWQQGDQLVLSMDCRRGGGQQRGDYRLAAGPDRDEVLELLRRQPADANLQVTELVAGAALQLLEARGIDVSQALQVLRQPGWLHRLAQQGRPSPAWVL